MGRQFYTSSVCCAEGLGGRVQVGVSLWISGSSLLCRISGVAWLQISLSTKALGMDLILKFKFEGFFENSSGTIYLDN